MGLNEHAWSVMNSFSPIDTTSLVGPLLSAVYETSTNKDMFRNRPIVPVHDEPKDLELRKHGKDSASRLGGWMQDAIGVDARKIDHFIEKQFGYVGRYAKDISDIGRDNRRGLGLHSTGLATGGTDAPVVRTLDVEWVQDYANRRGQTGKSWFKKFKQLKSDVFNTTGPDRQAKMEALHEKAKELRKEFDK
jgi:hypothetical protein